MKLLPVLSLLSLFLHPVFSHDLASTLEELGLHEYAKKLRTESPDLLKIVGKRNDITCFAPSNKAVILHRAKVAKLSKRGTPEDGASICHTKPSPSNVKQGSSAGGVSKRRQVGKRVAAYNYPDTNFEVIYTFLDDPAYVNLGHDNQTLRFSKNYATPSGGHIGSLSQIEVVSGLGNIQKTIRGPFKFQNGIIYEIDDFFTLPQPFSTTMQHLKLAQKFYKLVKKTGNLHDFEELPAVTIFAPLDSYNSYSYSYEIDPKSHILWSEQDFALYHTGDLMPGETLTSLSGAPIKVTFAENGERLVNCRRIVKPNVVTKNGVIHFIDGPLFGGEPCDAA